MIKTTEHIFQPGAMSIIQMGEEQIGHPSTAINELVKNGYDADAGNCWVYTHYDRNPEDTFIIIKDDGIGMDKNTLFGPWLRPSVSSKRDENKSMRRSKIYNRSYLGSKGIGRLAAMALGRLLTVITKTDTETTYNWLRLDREQFRVESLLNEVSFPGDQIEDYINLFTDLELAKKNSISVNEQLIQLIKEEPFGFFTEGTMIIVQDLDESIRSIIQTEFRSKNLEETSVFKSLRDLITPLKLNSQIQSDLVDLNIISKKKEIASGESTFALHYGINFIDDNFVVVEPSTIIDHFDYRVFGCVSSSGEVNGKYLCNRFENDLRNMDFNLSAEAALGDDEVKIRHIDELDDLNHQAGSNVGEFYFDFRIYDLDDDSKQKMVRLLKTDGRREANRIFKKFLGIKVSKNGFGVKPYGEEEHDWLGLGAKRVAQHIVSIGPNQIIGNTFLYSPQNDNLSEKTNREGFSENKAFINFKRILGGILSETGKIRAKYRAQHNLGRRTISKHDRPDTEKFIQYMLDRSSDAEVVDKTRAFIAETNSVLDNMEESLSFSQRLASLGTGLELVYHELAQPITTLGASKRSLIANADKISEEKVRLTMLDRITNIGTAITMLNELKNSLQPAIGKSIAQPFKPIDTFKKVCHLFENVMRELGIELVIKNNLANQEIKGFEYVFWVSFLNIINNAVYWLRFADQAKVITFEYESEEKAFTISNTGPKIPVDDIDIIFDYGITGKKEKNATGLGLSFTRNMLTSQGWNISAENKSYGPAFTIKPLDQ